MYGVKRKIILTKDYFDPEEKSIFSYNGANYCRWSSEIIDSDELPIT